MKANTVLSEFSLTTNIITGYFGEKTKTKRFHVIRLRWGEQNQQKMYKMIKYPALKDKRKEGKGRFNAWISNM